MYLSPRFGNLVPSLCELTNLRSLAESTQIYVSKKKLYMIRQKFPRSFFPTSEVSDVTKESNLKFIKLQVRNGLSSQLFRFREV